jgi:uncharacterized protein (TIGR04255 family)
MIHTVADQLPRPAHLADYDNPPIREAALGVEFTRLPGLRQAHLGLYWERVRSDYPIAEDYPALPPTQDSPVPIMMPAFQLNLGGTIPPQRAIFASIEKDRLIQVQQDRFIINWRGPGETYPRFDALRERFQTLWLGFSEFVTEEGIGLVLPSRVEIAYVNHIMKDSPAEFLNFAEQFGVSAPGVGPKPSDVKVTLRYTINVGEGQKGSLQVAVNRPVLTPFAPSQLTGGWVLTLIFRAPIPNPTDSEAVYPLLDRGREVIDQTFEDLTRVDIQRDEWKKRVG